MPVGPAAGFAGLSFAIKQAKREFQEWAGREFGKAAYGLDEYALNDFHPRSYAVALSFSRPEASSPLAMSIFVALYFRGAALARATAIASSFRFALSVLPFRKFSTAVSRSGFPEIPPKTT